MLKIMVFLLKVAFLGRPVDALSFISSSICQDEEEHKKSSTLSENPADTILDMLNTRDAPRKLSSQFDSTLKHSYKRQINVAVASKTAAGKLISSLLMSDMNSDSNFTQVRSRGEERFVGFE